MIGGFTVLIWLYLLHAGDGNAGRIPPVGPLCQTSERRWSKGRQVYGRVRLVDRFWLDDRSGNAVELALELDRIAGPDRLEHRHELVRPRSALAQAHSHSVKLVLGPAQAHADSQAPVRQDVQRGKTTGQHHGVVVEHVNHIIAPLQQGRNQSPQAQH
jgi:hypothetical protein